MAKIVFTVTQTENLPAYVESNYFRQAVKEAFPDEGEEMLRKFWKIFGPSTMLKLEEKSFGIYPWDVLAVMNRISMKVMFIDEQGQTLKFDPTLSGMF